MNMKAPCKTCPFMATTKPGALGGSEPEVYIGQLYAPFMLPCHSHCDFDDPDWKQKVMTTPQCAGAAMFRQAVGAADWLPEVIHRLPPSGPLLHSPELFYAHHKGISFEEAQEQLRQNPVHKLVRTELKKQIIRFPVGEKS